MSRRIVTTQLEGTGQSRQVDTYFDRVVKYIPADIVSAWIVVTNLIKSADNVSVNTLLWISFIFGIILTATWTLKQTSVPRKKIAITQTAISTVAFVVWVFALGVPFSTLGFYRPIYGSLILILYTLIVAIISPPEG
ncbi:MAG: hypothetical protein F6K65_33750 [Moorea sp. SIO3C2]|nr:hypothetical protein [Moorena sp. SIO3C2]